MSWLFNLLGNGSTFSNKIRSNAIVQPKNGGRLMHRRIEKLEFKGFEYLITCLVRLPSLSIRSALQTTKVPLLFSRTFRTVSTLLSDQISSWSERNMYSPLACSRAFKKFFVTAYPLKSPLSHCHGLLPICFDLIIVTPPLPSFFY